MIRDLKALHSPTTKYSTKFTWQKQVVAFFLVFLLSFTSVPTELFSGGFFVASETAGVTAPLTALQQAQATETQGESGNYEGCEACITPTDVEENESVDVRRRAECEEDERYHLAPEDFQFSDDSESEFVDLELVAITEDSNVFYNSDTEEEVEEFFASPIRFENEEGELVEIDPSLKLSEHTDFVYESRAGPSTNFFPETIDEETPLTLAREDYEIAFTLLEAQDITLTQIESQEHLDAFDQPENRPLAALYDIDADTSFRVISSDIGIKSEIILDTIPETNIFSYELYLTNLSAELSEETSEIILFSTNSPDVPVAAIPPGVMWDASEDSAYSHDIGYELERIEEGRYVLSLIVCKEYLNDPSRVFPITVDPTITWQGVWDTGSGRGLTTTFVRSGSPSHVFASQHSLPMGNNANGRGRSFLTAEDFNTTVRGRSVTSAMLHVRQMNNSSHTRNIAVSAHRVLPPTGSQTTHFFSMHWNNQPGHEAAATSSFSTGTVNWTHSFNVTNWARGVANGTFPGHGLMLRAQNENLTQIAEFYGAATAHGDRRPRLVVTTVNPPTPPSHVTLSNPVWVPGQAQPTLTWGTSTVAAGTLSRAEYRIIRADIDPVTGAHTNGTTVIKDFNQTPFLTNAQSTAGFSFPLTGLAHGCYMLAVRNVDHTGAAGGLRSLYFSINRNAPTIATSGLTFVEENTQNPNGSFRRPPMLRSGGLTISDNPWCSSRRISLEIFVRRPDGTVSVPRTILTDGNGRATPPPQHRLWDSDFIAGHSQPHTVVFRARNRVGHVSERTFDFNYDSSVLHLGQAKLTDTPESGWYTTNELPDIVWSDLVHETRRYSGSVTPLTIERRLQVATSRGANNGPLVNPVALTTNSLDASGISSIPDSFFPNGVPDGEHFLYVQPINANGRIGDNAVRVPYLVDTTAPELALTIAGVQADETLASSAEHNHYTKAQRISGSIRIDAEIARDYDTVRNGVRTSGFTGGHLRIESVGERFYTRDIPLLATASTSLSLDTRSLAAGLEDGTYRLTFTGQDRAGNIAEPAVVYFEVQNLLAAPRVTCAFGSSNLIGNTDEFLLSWNFPIEGALLREGVQWTVLGSNTNINVNDRDALSALDWTFVENSSNQGSFTAIVPRDAQGELLEGRYRLLVRAFGAEGITGQVTQVDLEVVLTAPAAEITGFEAGIVRGSVASSHLNFYEILVKESDAPEDDFERIVRGTTAGDNISLGFVDLAGDFPVNQSYTIRLKTYDLLGNYYYDDMEVYNALSSDDAVSIYDIDLLLPEEGKVTTADAHIETRADAEYDLTGFNWFVGGQARASSDTSSSSIFTDDFANYPYLEGSYHTILGTTLSQEQWKDSAPSATSARAGSASIPLEGSVTSGTESAELITENITTALPFTSLHLQGDIDGYAHVSVDGRTWKELTIDDEGERSWYISPDSDLIYATNFRLRFISEDASADLSGLSVNLDFVSPDIFHIDFLSASTPTGLVARDRLDYRTHFNWISAENKSEDITYEVRYVASISEEAALNIPSSLWNTVATGISESTFASPNFNYSESLFYQVVPVRSQVTDGKIISSVVGNPSNIAVSRAVDENELLKRLGIQDYWAYEQIEVPIGTARVEKSTGNMVYQHTDRTIESDTMLQEGLTRTHNSQSSLTFSFGEGTNFSYNLALLRQQGIERCEQEGRLVPSQNYVFQDETGTLRTFVYSEAHDTYFTRDSKRIRLEKFDEPRQVRVRTQVGTENTPHTYENLLVSYVITSHMKQEYWFNQGGQLVYVTHSPGQLQADIPEGQTYRIADHTQPYLTFDYCSETSLLQTITSRGLRSMRFAHNEERLISAVWMPCESVISYSYDEGNRLTKVTQHENPVTEDAFIAGTLPTAHAEDVYHSYTWQSLGLFEIFDLFGFARSNQARYFKVGIEGIARTHGAEIPKASFGYGRDLDDEMSVRVLSATTTLGDRTDFDYAVESSPGSMPSVVTQASRTPYGLEDPVTATKSTLNWLGHPTRTEVGTIAEVAAGEGHVTRQTWCNHLLETTAVDAEYHELAEDGTVITHTTQNVTRTGYNDLLLPTITEECSGITFVQVYNGTGINEEEVTAEIGYDEHGEVNYHAEYELDEEGHEVRTVEISHETTTTREYFADGSLRREATSLQRFEDGQVVGSPAPQVETVFGYDKWGNIVSEVRTEFGSPNAISEIARVFDWRGRLVSEQAGIRMAGGLYDVRSTTNSYDRAGRLTSSVMVEPCGTESRTSTIFNRDGTVASSTDEWGITTSFVYDIVGRVVSQTISTPTMNSNVIEDKVTLTEHGFETVEIKTPEGIRAYENTQTTTTTDPAGLVTKAYSDALGRTIRLSASGVNTDTSFTACGRVFATIVAPNNYAREDARVALGLFDRNGNQTHTIINPELTSGHFSVNKESIVTSQVLDASGRATESTDALGNTTHFTHDMRGEIATVMHPEADYIASGERSTERLVATVSFTNEEIEAGGITNLTIDALGNLSQTVQDPNGRMLSITDFGRGSRDIQATNDPAPVVTTFDYNELGQLARQTYANGDHIIFAYDAAGNQMRAEHRRANGTLELASVNTFDNRNRLLTVTDYSGEVSAQNVIYHQAFEYDIAGKRTSSFEDHMRPDVITEDMKTRFRFDVGDRIIGMDYPSFSELDLDTGSLTILGQDYSFDDFGRLDTITVRLEIDGEEESRILRVYSYDSWGQVEVLKDFDFWSGSQNYIKKSYTYDGFSRIKSIDYSKSTSPDTVFESFTYNFDKANNIISEHHIVSLPDTPSHDELRTYTYNEVGRLIRSESSLGGTSIYGWDRAGNRRLVSENGKEEWSDFNGLNQLTRKHASEGAIIYVYDANGNQVRETGSTFIRDFIYNADNRLTQVRTGTTQDNLSIVNTNTFRGDGQRISKVENGKTINYTYLDGTVKLTTDSNHSPINLHLKDPGGQLIGFAHYKNSGNAFSSVTTDIRNSTSTVLDSQRGFKTGFRYADFGETTRLQDTEELIEIAYTGGVWDEVTGLYYLNARFYNPVDARFMTMDVARNGGDLRATLSLYGYCEGDPINKTDPSGYRSVRRLPNIICVRSSQRNSVTSRTLRALSVRRGSGASSSFLGSAIEAGALGIPGIGGLVAVGFVGAVIWDNVWIAYGNQINLTLRATRNRDRSVTMEVRARRVPNRPLRRPVFVAYGHLRASFTPQYSLSNNSRFLNARARQSRKVPRDGFVQRWTIRTPSTARVRYVFHYGGNHQSSHATLTARAPR
ncbi:MAG: DNRLRE domain-containing protein [Coriobacteriia bacterium]|nr:DNRLRE domain-containing protein [Coriobacteriia bacterium]